MRIQLDGAVKRSVQHLAIVSGKTFLHAKQLCSLYLGMIKFNYSKRNATQRNDTLKEKLLGKLATRSREKSM